MVGGVIREGGYGAFIVSNPFDRSIIVLQHMMIILASLIYVLWNTFSPFSALPKFIKFILLKLSTPQF